MTNTELKSQIDLDVTNKTVNNSVTPTNVGNNIKAVVDYVDQEVSNIELTPGPMGPQGIAGPVGPAGLTWQGLWVSGTSYVEDDAVSYNGASWFCINATSGTTTPNLDPVNWALLAAQGSPGPQGPQGLPGNAISMTTENLGSSTTSAPFPELTAGITLLTSSSAGYALPATPFLGEIKYIRMWGNYGVTLWASPDPGNDGANNNFIDALGNGNISINLIPNRIYRCTYIGKFGSTYGYWVAEVINTL